MIKSSTVIKRMFKDYWKPVATFVGVISLISLTSILAGRLLGMDVNSVYWSFVLVWFIGAGIKWSYDSKKSQIEYEQKQLLRDIERKHL